MVTPSTLIDLYRELYELTNAICSTCSPPYHCCIPVGCQRAESWAKSYGEILPRYNNSDMPYLTENGCTVAPHLRLICTGFICPEREKPPRYQELMAEIARLEGERFKK